MVAYPHKISWSLGACLAIPRYFKTPPPHRINLPHISYRPKIGQKIAVFLEVSYLAWLRRGSAEGAAKAAKTEITHQWGGPMSVNSSHPPVRNCGLTMRLSKKIYLIAPCGIGGGVVNGVECLVNESKKNWLFVSLTVSPTPVISCPGTCLRMSTLLVALTCLYRWPLWLIPEAWDLFSSASCVACVL